MVDVSSSCADIEFHISRLCFILSAHQVLVLQFRCLQGGGMFGNYRQVFVDTAGILSEPIPSENIDCISFQLVT